MSDNKPKPKLNIPIYDAVVDIPDAEPAAPVETEGHEESTAPVKAASKAPSSPRYVIGSGDTDLVLLSKINYKDIHHRKVMAVHHLQRRLLEWGYPDAYADKDGYYGDLTEKSVREFQNDHGLAGDGKMNAETLLAIFENDQNVTVVIDR
jgi:hypothetical protein